MDWQRYDPTVSRRRGVQPILFHEFDIRTVVVACPESFGRLESGSRGAGSSRAGFGGDENADDCGEEVEGVVINPGRCSLSFGD